jgi:aldose 1-epimerase
LGKFRTVIPAAASIDSTDTRNRRPFGRLPGGGLVEIVTLTSGGGLQAQVLNLGAALHSMTVPDRDGNFADVVLDHPDLRAMLARPQYFGATIGRFANRIANSSFSLEGRAYVLSANDGAHSLHGGVDGFDKALWRIVASSANQVTLTHVSPDGDQGYPGTLTATAIYTLDDDDQLSIEYLASTDRPTLVNLTHHAYWNLAGEGSGSAMEHELRIAADSYTPIDAQRIPTGEIRPVAGTAFDFRIPKSIAMDMIGHKDPQLAHGDGYDHNWATDPGNSRELGMVAQVRDPHSGRVLTLMSTQPGLQFYSGNFLDGSIIGKSGRPYCKGDAFALEPQHYPDTPNQPAFPPARLAPGEVYRSLMAYRFSTDQAAGAGASSQPGTSG